MSSKLPRVSAGSVYDPTSTTYAIRLDTPAWFAWLTEATTTRFSYPLFDPRRGYIVSFMTVRKEQRQRGTSYWVVFHRDGARVCKRYLGSSATVTDARLLEVAEIFRARWSETHPFDRDQ